mmetsp:Transcript_8888/g.27927  ORF Transcript_8888/g.27927 Transcript_8888/m.27927 type:complete len:202 (+) Transcript_8888:312-917(+)
MSWSAVSMTCVSSECSRPRSRHGPRPSAAMSSTRFEIDFEPGTRIRTHGEPYGGGTTVSAGERIRASVGSGTGCGMSCEEPIPLTIVHRTAPAAFFLSSFILERRASTVRPGGNAVGRPNALRQRTIRPTAAVVSSPRSRASAASAAIPIATHSPCSSCGDLSASTACPTVCPKFKVERTPISFSSRATTSALRRIASPTT